MTKYRLVAELIPVPPGNSSAQPRPRSIQTRLGTFSCSIARLPQALPLESGNEIPPDFISVRNRVCKKKSEEANEARALASHFPNALTRGRDPPPHRAEECLPTPIYWPLFVAAFDGGVSR
jgi:hypothetical protein